MIWYVDPLGEFYNCNEDATVYFDPASGDTHLLTSFSAHLLQLLAEQPMSSEQLVARISSDIDPNELPELSQTVPDVLVELAALDVITQR